MARNPRKPGTVEEWQAAVDAAEALLALESARQYGLVTGGPEIDLERCEEIIREGARRGVTPAADCTKRLIDELMGVRRCRVCGCTDAEPCEEGCEWVEADLCSACAVKGKTVARRGAESAKA